MGEGSNALGAGSRGRSCRALRCAAGVLVLAVGLPTLAAADGWGRDRHGFVGLWGVNTTCITANDRLWSYRRDRVDIPAEVLAPGNIGCRILSRRGTAPWWRLELRCAIGGAPEQRRTTTMTQDLRIDDHGYRLDVRTVDRSTGETQDSRLFFCRRHHDPERLPRGLLD